MPRTFRLPSAMPSTQTNASAPIACAIGWLRWSSKSQLMVVPFHECRLLASRTIGPCPSTLGNFGACPNGRRRDRAYVPRITDQDLLDYRRRRFYLRAGASGVALEVLIEKAGEFFRGGVVSGFVGPAFPRTQNFRRHIGAFCDNVETKYWIARGLRVSEGPGVNCVDDRSCVFETDPFAGTVSAASPTSVYEPHPCLVLPHFFCKQLGIFARMPNQKWSAEARRERRLRFSNTHLGAGDFCGVAADEMIHRVRGRKRADGRQHTKGVAREKDNVGRMTGDTGNLRVLDKLYRVRASGILRDADVGVIDIAVLIEHNVLYHSAETQCLKNVRLAFGRKINRLGVTAAFDIENAIVTPDML